MREILRLRSSVVGIDRGLPSFVRTYTRSQGRTSQIFVPVLHGDFRFSPSKCRDMQLFHNSAEIVQSCQFPSLEPFPSFLSILLSVCSTSRTPMLIKNAQNSKIQKHTKAVECEPMQNTCSALCLRTMHPKSMLCALTLIPICQNASKGVSQP